MQTFSLILISSVFSPRYTGLSLPYLFGLLPHLLSHDTAGVPGGGTQAERGAFFG
jgi:hypothetical protein